MPFPEGDYLYDVCKVHSGSLECRYLAAFGRDWSCEKHSPLRRSIDERNRRNHAGPRGDNCEGKDWR